MTRGWTSGRKHVWKRAIDVPENGFGAFDDFSSRRAVFILRARGHRTRVEHIVSGESGEFRSVEELLRFIALLLRREDNRSEPSSPHSGYGWRIEQ